MCLFKETHFGELLEVRISSFLSEYIKKDDMLETAKKFRISYHTLRQVVSRNVPMSEKTSKAVQHLMKVAVDNCGNVVRTASNDKKLFSKLLNL